MTEDDLFDDEEKPERIIVCSRCERPQPAYKFVTTTGTMSKRCEDCRKRQGAKMRAARGNKTSAVAKAAPPVVTTTDRRDLPPITLRLTASQAERLTALVLREIIRDDPTRLALALPSLLELLVSEAAE